MRTDRPVARGVAAGAAFALAIGTKPSAALAVAGIIVGIVVAGRSAVPGLGRRAVAAVGTIAAAGAAWAIVVIPQPGVLDSILRIWAVQAAPASAIDVWQRVIDYVGESDRAIPMTAPLLVGSVLGIGLVAAQLAVARPRPARARRRRDRLAGVRDGDAARRVVSAEPVRRADAAGDGDPHRLRGRARRGAPAPRQGGRGGWRPSRSASAWHFRAFGTSWDGRQVRRIGFRRSRRSSSSWMTDGHAIEGAGSPTFAMRVPVPAIVARPGLNDGDLYATHGVRWLLADPQARPAWASDHPDAWADRERIACYPVAVGRGVPRSGSHSSDPNPVTPCQVCAPIIGADARPP